ncbi:flagellar hook capping FlgD N-terminal domain-containing protein, partial [Streptomyces scabiei]|uniref:flagellar hook capping FlgD N-terminal domain-containing protein n=1 Tax=Streptomyces scabiei TaxID=1930 RepID=UPI0038F67C72
NTTTTSSNPNKDAAAASLDYSTFLNLLLAQLKNQDPTKPMDSTEYMSQLASFSNVEQTIKTNAKLDSMLTTQSLSQAENLIGKTVSNSD